MRDYGRVHTSFWTSETTRSLSEDGRALALYLLTSPHSTLAGVFRLPDGYVCDDMQWTSQRVSKGFAELLANGFANRCETTKWVLICKYLQWNIPENPNQKKSAAKIVDLIPKQCSWLPCFIRENGEFLGLKIEQFANCYETVSKPEVEIGTEIETEIKEKNTKKEKVSVAFVLPDWINSEDWELWLKTRKKKMVPEQMQAQVRKLEKWKNAGLDYSQALNDAAVNGWQGLIDPTEKQRVSNENTGRKTYHEELQDTRRQIFGEINHGTKHKVIDITPRETDRGDSENF